MVAGMLLLGVLSGVLGALTVALAGGAMPFTMLAYSVSGTVGLLSMATWNGLRVAAFETAHGRPRA
jgi:hypothetical protein